MEKPLYFAYGSNINLDQMRYGEALCLIGEYVTITDINDHSHSKCRNSRTDHER